MNKAQSYKINDMDVKVRIGDILINILHINYEAPIPLRYFNTHCHSSYELHFIPAGKGTVRIMNNTYNITPGTFYITGPNIYHEQIADSEDPFTEYAIDFDFCMIGSPNMKSSYSYIYEEDNLEDILRETNFWFGHDEFNSWTLLEKFFLELEQKNLGYITVIQSLLAQILINVVRNCSNQKKSNYNLHKKQPIDRRRAIIDVFFRDYDKDLRPTNLAKKLNVCVRQLERIMQHYYNMSFKEKLLSTRIEIVKDFLINTDITMDKISSRAGFSSPSYFSRLFKEKEGCSPSDYRRKYSRSSNIVER